MKNIFAFSLVAAMAFSIPAIAAPASHHSVQHKKCKMMHHGKKAVKDAENKTIQAQDKGTADLNAESLQKAQAQAPATATK